jgi:hypothetical protein
MLAMLYLVLFSTLATAFYSAFTMAVQISYNDRGARRALVAAESGMEFIRFHLWSLDIEHNTSVDELFDRVYDDLAGQLNGSANLGGGSITQTGEKILIPGDPAQYVALANGDSFRIEIERSGKELLVSVIGRTSAGITASSPACKLRLRYGIFERPSSIFDFGVASRSAINMVGNTDILGYPDPSSGSVLSTASVDYPLTMGSNCGISGEVSFSSPGAWVDAGTNSVINNEVGEANWADNVHEVDQPDFPVVDTADFAALAVNTITSSSPASGSFTNIRIPAGLNPVFNSDVALLGVVYIEEPNVVKFNGHVTVTGVIVVENNDGTNWQSNSIKFLGGATATGPEGLPEDDPQFAELRDMNGAFHPLGARGQAAKEVAAADHDRGLDAEMLDLVDVFRDLRRDGGIDAELLLTHQRLA